MMKNVLSRETMIQIFYNLSVKA